MPNIKSAKKRMRTAEKSRQANRSIKNHIVTARVKLKKAVDLGDKALSQKLFSAYNRVVDKAAKKGILKLNAASRRKSRAAKLVANIS